MNDYKNLQVSTATLAGFFVTNAAESKTQGAEFELTYQTQLGVVLMANYSLLDASFEKGNNVGNSLAFSPENSYAIGAQYEMDFASGTLDWFAMYAWQDDFYYDADNKVLEDARGLLNAKVTYRPNSDGWDIALGVKNATDKKYTSIRQDIGLGPMVLQGLPRMVMAEFNLYF